ncbi:MAG: DUF6691 family protein [Pikeienuella sp.]
MRLVVAALAGGVFGLGLVVSDMINPARVLAFLDIASGAWDPTLAFVMAGAMVPMVVAWALTGHRAAPALGGAFPEPSRGLPDGRLLSGAALFGLGWGVSGLCPGPAVAGISIGGWPVALFGLCMLLGLALSDRALRANSA